MKKIIYLSVMALTCVSVMTSCNSNKFKTTESGLQYRFEVVNNEGEQPQVGDVLVGELTLKLDTVQLFSNTGNPDRIMQVAQNMFKGDINEGLLMMHEGDKAVFCVEADSIGKFLMENQMPPQYKKGSGQKFYYEITLNDIVSKEEMAQEQANFMEEMQQREANEPQLLAQYIKDNNITVKPTASGLYIVVKKKGNGPKVGVGKTVSIDYTGRLLDGTIFDSSREADAKASGKEMAGRTFEPLTYVVGQQPLIKGWDEGVMNQPEGTEMTIIMPSSLGYGARGAGRDILPYSPLVFDLTIVSVK